MEYYIFCGVIPDYFKKFKFLTVMAGLAALCLLLIFPLGSSQSTLKSEQDASAHQAPPPVPPPHIQDLLLKEESAKLNAQRTYFNLDKEDGKIGLFIAASVGTFTLMIAVYCIYNRFYTKHQYLHTQLTDDSDVTADSMDPPVLYHGAAGGTPIQKAGYGSLADTPSIISVPPSLSPPLSAMPFPPRFLSSRSLRTISAQDLEKSCI